MRLFLLIMITFISFSVQALDFEEGETYRLNKTVLDIELARDITVKGVAVKDSKFIVVDATNANHYIVRFVTLYKKK